MNLQKYSVNNSNDNGEIFHSNAYARVASGGSIGSMNARSFQSRMDVHRNRRTVKHYGASLVGRVGQEPYSRGTGLPPRSPAVPVRTTFREPPARYNPYK